MMLYNIDQAISEAWDAAIDPETGEIVNEEALADLKDLLKQRTPVLEETLLCIKEGEALDDAIGAEIKALSERRAAARKRTNAMKECVANSLAGEKFETAKVKVSWRKSQVAEYVGAIEDLPEECIRYALPEVNKAELKKLLKAGTEIPGAKLITKNNMQIK